jgi:hypothetical protein
MDSVRNFTGVWEMDLERSTLRGDPPTRLVIKIDHAEPKLVQEIRVTRKDGSESSGVFQFDTSGGETVYAMGRSLARWAGQELLIESWMETKDRTLHFRDYCSLSADGETLVMEHRDDDLAGQITVLRRQCWTS